MTVFEKIKSMSIDEMAKFISGFDKDGLEGIETIFCMTLCPHHKENYGCEFEDDHKCVVDDISMIKTWLEMEVENASE